MENIFRRLTLLLALLLAVGGFAMAEEVPNPRQEMAGAAEAEAALGFPVAVPENVEAEYVVINGSTGEATFTTGELRVHPARGAHAGRHFRTVHGNERAGCARAGCGGRRRFRHIPHDGRKWRL